MGYNVCQKNPSAKKATAKLRHFPNNLSPWDFAYAYFHVSTTSSIKRNFNILTTNWCKIVSKIFFRKKFIKTLSFFDTHDVSNGIQMHKVTNNNIGRSWNDLQRCVDMRCAFIFQHKAKRNLVQLLRTRFYDSICLHLFFSCAPASFINARSCCCLKKQT